jgi:hypothetical protein
MGRRFESCRAHHKQSPASLTFRASSLRYSFSVFIVSIRFALVILVCAFSLAHAQSYKYFRLGNPSDVETKARFGIAMMGGGSDLDEAFRWLCNKGNGGDFLVLRASGDDDYNSYINGLCKTNSVATHTILSAPVEAPPTRSTASHFSRSRIAMGWKTSLNTSSPIVFDPPSSTSGSFLDQSGIVVGAGAIRSGNQDHLRFRCLHYHEVPPDTFTSKMNP